MLKIVYWSDSPGWCCSVALKNNMFLSSDHNLDALKKKSNVYKEWIEKKCSNLVINYGAYACRIITNGKVGGNSK